MTPDEQIPLAFLLGMLCTPVFAALFHYGARLCRLSPRIDTTATVAAMGGFLVFIAALFLLREVNL